MGDKHNHLEEKVKDLPPIPEEDADYRDWKRWVPVYGLIRDLRVYPHRSIMIGDTREPDWQERDKKAVIGIGWGVYQLGFLVGVGCGIYQLFQ